MELRDYFPILRRNVVFVVVLVLIGGIGGLAFGASRPASYSADSKVFVSAKSASTVAEISAAATYITQAVASYADVATSALVLDPVIRQLDLDDSVTSLKSRITVTATNDETVLDIKADAATPQQAADLANAVGRQLSSAVQTLTSGTTGTTAALELTLVDPAVVPTAPQGPGAPVFIAVGLVVGLLAGFIVAVLRETLDSRLATEREVAHAAEAPVLGSIPRVGRQRSRAAAGTRALGPVQAEAFRSVRNALQFLRVDGGVHSLVVTSAVPGDGKTAVSINLASALADNGERVLLIDGDLRKPDLATYLGLDGTIGLTDVLIGRVSVTQALQKVGESSLFALPAGSTAPNPNELIQSDAMRQVMTDLLQQFDRIIIDSPPQMPVSDAGILARLTDGALIVVSTGRTSRSQLTTVVERLRRVDAHVLGAVLNSTRPKPDETTYGGAAAAALPVAAAVGGAPAGRTTMLKAEPPSSVVTSNEEPPSTSAMPDDDQPVRDPDASAESETDAASEDAAATEATEVVDEGRAAGSESEPSTRF